MRVQTMTIDEAKVLGQHHAIEALSEKTFWLSDARRSLKRLWMKYGSVGRPLLIQYGPNDFLPARFFQTKRYPTEGDDR